MFYKNSKILIAGASGLVGRNLFLKLKSSGDDVYGTYFSRPYNDLIYCDLTNKENVSNLFDSIGKVDYVFLPASQSYNALVADTNPEIMTVQNVVIAGNILEESLRREVKKVLFFSSATVYQPSFKELSEEDLDWNKNPNDLYMGVGWAKRYIEKLCEFYSKLGLLTLIVRPTNIYGKFDKNDNSKNHFVPAMISRAKAKESPFVVRGNGKSIKDFIYVDDVVADSIRIMEQCENHCVFNLCSGKRLSLRGALLEILEAFEHYIEPEFEKSQEQVPFVALNRNKLDSICGKRKYVDFYDGIRQIIA